MTFSLMQSWAHTHYSQTKCVIKLHTVDRSVLFGYRLILMRVACVYVLRYPYFSGPGSSNGLIKRSQREREREVGCVGLREERERPCASYL